MNEDILKTLVIHSTTEVFEKMITLHVSPEAAQDETLFNGEVHVCATIGFAGEWHGFLSLQCGEELAYQVTSKLLVTDMGDLEKADVWDAMGEVVNMIGGRFKAIFAESYNDGHEAFKMSLPTVIMGSNYSLIVVGGDRIPETIMQADGKKFSIKLALKKVEA
jgi:CheY-specific phosphatase CheX